MQKGLIPDVGHRVWDGQFGQLFAVLESHGCNSSFMVGNFSNNTQIFQVPELVDRLMIGAYHKKHSFEHNTHNIICNQPCTANGLIIPQRPVSNNNLHCSSLASHLVQSFSDLPLELQACRPRRHLKFTCLAVGPQCLKSHRHGPATITWKLS